MHKRTDGDRSPREHLAAVLAEVRRAARLIDTGLWTFDAAVQGATTRRQFDAAAGAADASRTKVVAPVVALAPILYTIVHIRIPSVPPSKGAP